MAQPIDVQALYTAIASALQSSKLKLTEVQLQELAEDAARAADSAHRAVNHLGRIRQSTFDIIAPKEEQGQAPIRIDPTNNLRLKKRIKARGNDKAGEGDMIAIRGKVASVHLQAVEIVGYLALAWYSITGRTPPKQIVDNYIDPFLKYVEAVYPFIQWAGDGEENRDDPSLRSRTDPRRRASHKVKPVGKPNAKDAIRGWIRMRLHVQ
jgi:hypothetical protein